MPHTVLQLCKNIKMDRAYNNVCDDNMVNVVGSTYVKQFTRYSYIRQTQSIKVETDTAFPMESIIECNYLSFINAQHENKRYYGWIDRIEYVNEKTVEIFFTLDYWSTYYPDLIKLPVFVEREHVNDDSFGANSAPEPIKPDKLISNTTVKEYYDDYSIVMFYVPAQISAADLAYSLNDRYYTYAMCHRYDCSQQGIAALQSHLARTTGQPNANVTILGLNVIPNDFFLAAQLSAVDQQISVNSVITKMIQLTAPADLNAYVPVNKKCFCYPYNFLSVSNGNVEKIYRYEKFNLNLQGAGQLKITAGVIPNGGATLYPMNYDNIPQENTAESLDLGDLPMIVAAIDSYAAWQAQKSSGAVMQGIMSTLTGALAGGVKGGLAGAALGAGAGLVGGITNYVTQEEAARAEQDRAVGTNNVTLDMLNGLLGYTICQRCAVRDDAIRIDRFFSQFGYNVSEVKQPNYTGRQYWNYVKINGSAGYGPMPEDARDKLNEILNKGTTIWHSHANLGNYFIGGTRMQNPIVS